MATNLLTAGRYFGSIDRAHGAVLSINDCTCARCGRLNLWDERRRFSLIVRADTDGEVLRLECVGAASFTGSR